VIRGIGATIGCPALAFFTTDIRVSQQTPFCSAGGGKILW
jgi:hypothetical protein